MYNNMYNNTITCKELPVGNFFVPGTVRFFDFFQINPK